MSASGSWSSTSGALDDVATNWASWSSSSVAGRDPTTVSSDGTWWTTRRRRSHDSESSQWASSTSSTAGRPATAASTSRVSSVLVLAARASPVSAAVRASSPRSIGTTAASSGNSSCSSGDVASRSRATSAGRRRLVVEDLREQRLPGLEARRAVDRVAGDVVDGDVQQRRLVTHRREQPRLAEAGVGEHDDRVTGALGEQGVERRPEPLTLVGAAHHRPDGLDPVDALGQRDAGGHRRSRGRAGPPAGGP